MYRRYGRTFPTIPGPAVLAGAGATAGTAAATGAKGGLVPFILFGCVDVVLLVSDCWLLPLIERAGVEALCVLERVVLGVIGFVPEKECTIEGAAPGVKVRGTGRDRE
jgi:hypothetical protein